MKNKTNTGLFFLFLGLIMGAVVLLAGKNVLSDKPTDISEQLNSPEGLKNNSYVEFTVDAVFGNYAETVHKSNGVERATKQHYVVMLDDGSVISLTVGNKRTIAKLEELTLRTYDAIEKSRDGIGGIKSSYKITLKGLVGKIDPGVLGYYNEALDYLNFNKDTTIRQQTIDTSVSVSVYRLIMFAAVACAVIGVLILFSASKEKKAEIQEPEDSSYMNDPFSAYDRRDQYWR